MAWRMNLGCTSSTDREVLRPVNRHPDGRLIRGTVLALGFPIFILSNHLIFKKYLFIYLFGRAGS